jgi:hypothetical protein
MNEQRRQEEDEMCLRQKEETEVVRREMQVEEDKEINLADLKRISLPLKRPYWKSLIVDKFD